MSTLTFGQYIPGLVFLAVLGTVYGLAFWFVLSAACRKLASRKVDRSRPRKVLEWSVRLLAAVGLLCMGYGYFIEPYWLEVTRVRIDTPKLPAGTAPIRLVHISDLHCDPKQRLEDDLPGHIEALHPDVIVFTGDSINSRGGLANFRRCMKRLADVAPAYAVEGNWDVYHFRDVPLFAGTGVRLLRCGARRVEVGGASLWVAGLAAGRGREVDKALAAVPDGALTVFLYHYPDLIYVLADRDVDVCCAGHTHGGQVALPWVGGLICVSKYGRRFERGLHRVEGTWMYVSRGIGMEGGPFPRVRFGARPEVTVIDIHPASPTEDAGADLIDRPRTGR